MISWCASAGSHSRRWFCTTVQPVVRKQFPVVQTPAVHSHGDASRLVFRVRFPMDFNNRVFTALPVIRVR